jgi:sialidase-1
LSLCFNDVTTVFSTGMAGEHCYRIPTIIHLKQGPLLAFAEQRDPGCGDGGSNNLVMRRSTDDGQPRDP